MNTEAFLSLLQFSDGLFPAGAYAHSFGLEYCAQTGAVRDRNGVKSFIEANLEGALGPTDAVAVLLARDVVQQRRDLAFILTLDETLDAMKPIAELRNASRQMGRQTLRIAAHMVGHSLLDEFFRAVESVSTPGHHPVAFGAVGGLLGWTPEETARAFLYSSSAAMVGASLRLLPLGQLAGQRILWELQPLIGRLADQARNKSPEEMWSFAPGLEVAALRHATLEARLFRS